MKLSTAIGPDGKGKTYEESVYRMVYDAGYRYINYNFPLFHLDAPTSMDYMSDDWEKVAQDHRMLMDKVGVTPIMAHGPYSYPMPDEAKASFVSAFIRAVESCKVMRIPYIVLHPHARKGMSYDEFLAENCELFKQFIPVAEKTGVMILVENIGQYSDPHFVRDGAELRRLIETVEHPLFAACWDTGHANHIVDDQRESLLILGDLLKGLHINDNLGDMQPQRYRHIIDLHTLPLFGSVDFDSIISTLKEIGYSGYFNFETAVPRGRKFKEGQLIQNVLPELKKHALHLEHEIGRLMLEAYGCYEE